MVGNEERNGHKCRFMPNLHCLSFGGSLCEAGACILECSYKSLEGGPCPDDGDAKDQATAEAAAEAGFHDPLGSRALSMAREAYAASGEIFPDRLVHGQPPKRYYWFKMVDD